VHQRFVLLPALVVHVSSSHATDGHAADAVVRPDQLLDGRVIAMREHRQAALAR
jgi:hypothetical protein